MNKEVPLQCEVLVIGGGPGGSTVASLLAKKGIDVIVFEKELFPRATVGESLIPHFWKYTDLIGASDKIKNAGFIPKRGGVVMWEEKLRKVSFKDFDYKRPGMHVERAEFDDILLKHSEELGAAVFHQVRATKIEHGIPWTTIHYQKKSSIAGKIQAKFIVDASGQGALLSKQENTRVFDDGFRFQAFWGYYEGGQYIDGDNTIRQFGQQREHSPMTFVGNLGEWGWFWQIVLQKTISIGIVLPKKNVPKFKAGGESLAERFDNALIPIPVLGELMKDARLKPETVRSIKDYSYRPTQLTSGNCLLVGDAAAFVDPINSAGVVMAMYSGFVAAWTIQRILKKPHQNENLKSLFERQVNSRFDLFRLLAYPEHLVIY